MGCNTGTERVFDVGSLYVKFCSLSDKRKPKGLRYCQEMILVVMTLAKICGEDNPSGIADCDQRHLEEATGI
jgi:hypothetical protein